MNEYYFRALQVFPNVEDKMDCLRGRAYWVRSKIGRFRCVDMRGCLLTYPSWEKHVKKAIRDLSKAGGLFVDVGANIGVLSVYASKLGFSVLALEPQPEVFAALQDNLAANHVDGTAYRLAAWRERDTLRMKKDQKNLVLSKLDPAGDLEVQAITLDSLGVSPAVVKVDVEGAEVEVMRGMGKTLERAHPALVYESYLGSKPAACRGFLKAFGYEVEKLDGINWLAL
jgi:FkbM family methyltransferase